MANILIVDDSIVMRNNLADIFTGAGHQVIGQAEDGKEAVSQYLKLRPDIVTMDISMPIQDGVVTVREIIAQDPDAKIVMISAVNQKKMVFKAITNGAKHYIVKPINAPQLLHIIDDILKTDLLPQPSIKTEIEKPRQGFMVDNVNGSFVIRFTRDLGIKDHNLLNMAVRGLMFIKPLVIEFNFEETGVLKSDILDPILRLTRELTISGAALSYKGTAELVQYFTVSE